MFLAPNHLDIVKRILIKYPYSFYAFGSRVTGTHKPLSDLDLCFIEKIPGNILSHIEEEFEESDLPYKVDLVHWDACNSTFKTLIKNDLTPIQVKES